jgi:hypothetical protein
MPTLTPHRSRVVAEVVVHPGTVRRTSNCVAAASCCGLRCTPSVHRAKSVQRQLGFALVLAITTTLSSYRSGRDPRCSLPQARDPTRQIEALGLALLPVEELLQVSYR